MTSEQFLLIAGPLPEPMLLVSGAGLILAGNRATEARLGISLSDLLGKNLTEVAADPPDEVARYLRLCSRSRNLVLGALVLQGQTSSIACRVEGALVRPRTESGEAILMLRLMQKESAVGHFVALNQRVEALALEVQRRRQAEESVRQQEERLRVTLHSIGDAVIVTDPDSRVVLLNPVAEALTGWKQDQALGQPLDSVFHIVNEETRGTVANPALRALREGIIVGLANHTVLIARDGAEHPIDDSAAPIRDSQGNIVGAVLVFRDISLRQRAERQVRATEQRFLSFMNNSPTTAFIKDSAGRYVFVNRQIEKAIPYPQADWIGKTDYDIFSPEEAEQFTRNDEMVLASRTTAQFLETVNRPAGAHHFLSFKFPLQDVDGSWLLAGMSIDITEQVRAQTSLRESEERFRTLAESIPQLAWAARPDGHIFWYNRRWYEYTGTTPEEMEGWGWQEVHEPAKLPQVMARWKDSILTGQPFDMVFPLRGADGQFRPFLTRVLPLKDSAGRVLQWFGTNTDISEQQAMEEALREEDRRKNEFLATLAHELRNPLAPIRNGLQILRLADKDRAAAEQARVMMERQMHHLVRLVDDLLDLSRISRGKIELRKERIELASVISGTLEAFEGTIKQTGHILNVKLPEEQVYLEADRTRLAQILTNLLSNAAKYSEPGSQIRLIVEREQNQVVFRVRDTGIGIPTPMLPKIFDMFTQVDSSLEKANGGLGIGLNIVKRLVELHEGGIEARSEGPGMGSEFILRLPIALSVAQEGPMEQGPPIRGSGKRHRILVVDDNQDAASSLAMMLKLMGNEVRTAHDGLEGLAAAQALHPDIILLDIGMPRLNGYETCRRIREQPWGQQVIIIALTGWGQEEDRRRSQEAGFDHHLVKPVEPAALDKLLNSMTQRKAE